jgi:Rieske Fe-S protein
MIRRAFLALWPMLLGVPRRAWAQVSSATPQYAGLKAAIHVPLPQLAESWSPVAFTAEGLDNSDAAAPGRRVLLKGVVYRVPAGGGSPELSAVCLTCPHERCEVQFVADPARVAKMTSGSVTHPMFECGCHFSVFDPSEAGAKVSGPTPRGLYRFNVRTAGDAVEVYEVEQDALSFV